VNASQAGVPPDAAVRAGAHSWWIVAQGSLAMAASLGVGRFVYTPILPLMQAQAGMSAQLGSAVASVNLFGYLVGAIVASLVPGWARSVLVLRVSLVVLTLTLAGMPLRHSAALWLGLRGIAGVASALSFVVASNATLARLRGHASHRLGWVYGGVGVGIALSGLLILAVRTSWSEAWWVSAVLTVPLAVVAWRLPAPPAVIRADTPAAGRQLRARTWFGTLLVSYVLEGAGYIIAGTFLVAAIDRTGPDLLGSSAWVLAGIAAVPSCAAWVAWSRRWSRSSLLLLALVVQAIGIALPALSTSIAAAIVAAVVFGGTFVGITALALAAGSELQIPRAAAVLTSGYATGQVLGPLGVTPFLDHGYHTALLVAAVIVLIAAVAAALPQARYFRTRSMG
jgi:MFS family permease